MFEAQRYSDAIRQIEEERGHERTILVGDLNMNPFDPGVVSAGALNAVMTRAEAMQEAVVVRSERYRLFYNPMWAHFGDGTPGPPGTYYHRSASGRHFRFKWNIFDHVLLRPSMLSRFRNDSLKILSWDGLSWSETEQSRPSLSDHNPVFFALDL